VPSVDRSLRPLLLDAYLKLDAFADAYAALDGLKAQGARVAILSNGSPRMRGAAVEAAGMTALLDAVLSVDTVRAYKPKPEVYALVTNKFGIRPEEIVFVSSNRWDVMGAASFGFRPVWINRAHAPNEYPDLAPLHEISDLATLANLKRHR
jgi:2-haloacid dehalogenase